jgi:hypothetical protein
MNTFNEKNEKISRLSVNPVKIDAVKSMSR